jgi:hypothetical protein
VDNGTALIEENWEEYPNGAERESLGAEFFIKRKNAEMASDNVYTGDQDTEKLPNNWNPNRRNFVIFNSSEDEFFCVGESFDRHKLFANQIDGIRHVITSAAADPSIHCYLRVHPNLRSIKFSYHTMLAEVFADCPNLTIIPADSPVWTYGLIDSCEKVLVFGSTVGVEACYWRKPVILIGAAYYMYLDVAYRAKTLEELDALLFAVLEPKPKLGTLKYGLFVFGERGAKSKYFDFDYRRYRIAGKILAVPLCFAYKGSLLPYVLFAGFFRVLNLIPHLFFKKISMRKLLVEKDVPA